MKKGVWEGCASCVWMTMMSEGFVDLVMKHRKIATTNPKQMQNVTAPSSTRSQAIISRHHPSPPPLTHRRFFAPRSLRSHIIIALDASACCSRLRRAVPPTPDTNRKCSNPFDVIGGGTVNAMRERGGARLWACSSGSTFLWQRVQSVTVVVTDIRWTCDAQGMASFWP